MLQTDKNHMSTNYRVSTPEQFFDIANNTSKDNSFIDQLAVGLKSSLKVVWGYLKNLEVKPKSKVNNQESKQEGGNIDLVDASVKVNENKDKALQKLAHQKTSNNVKKSIIPQGQLTQKQTSKKQRLQQKKQQKKVISFDDFVQQQQKKLNQSYIRKNIQQKKTLNRSLLSQENNLNNSLILGNNNTSHSDIGKSAGQLLKASVLQNGTILNDTVLNISDIDSQCNFNILNNSDVFDLSDRNGKKEGNEDEEEEKDIDDAKINGRKKLELKLSEYPFLMPGRKLQVPKGKIPSKNFSSTLSKTPLDKISSKSIPYLDNQQQYIDVDNTKSPYRQQQAPSKRGLSPSVPRSQTQMRKKVKQNHEIEEFFESRTDQKSEERREKFDKLLEGRYEKLVEDMLGQKVEESSKEKQFSLKDDYQKYIAKNFGAMQYAKKRIQSRQSQRIPQPPASSQESKSKISQILKPLDLAPQIERKKLYNFTRQCESKINICFELEKSVREDKERQFAQQMRKKHEEEMRLRREEEERRKKEELERKRLEQEERKRIQKEQQALRIAQQINNQQQQEQTVPVSQITQKPPTTDQAQDLKSSGQKSQLQASSKSQSGSKPQQQGPKQTKQPTKPSLSLFGAAAASLFKTAKPQEPPSQNVSKQDKEQAKETQSGILKKTSSTVDAKPTDSQKKAESGSKSPEIPSTLEKKESPKEQSKQQKPKFNPFLAAVTTKPQITKKLQEMINSKKDDNSLFKTVTSTTPAGTSPQRQAPQPTSASFMSPVHTKHNTSHYSNLDSSMMEESQSNITPANSHMTGNQAGGMNGGFLNNSFTSQQSSGLFPVTQTTTPTGSLFGGNAGSTLFGSAYNPMNPSGGLFSNTTAQQKPPTPTGGLFGSNQSNMFMPTPINPMASNITTQAVNKIPSFMQNQPSIAPGINPQSAMSLFNQRSPTKNQNQSLFGPPPPQSDKRPTGRRDKRSRDERIR